MVDSALQMRDSSHPALSHSGCAFHVCGFLEPHKLSGNVGTGVARQCSEYCIVMGKGMCYATF